MYSYGSPHTAAQKQDDQHERTFSSYVRIQVVVLKTYLGRWTIGRSGERGSGISVLPARYDDDDDDDIYIYIYIQVLSAVSRLHRNFSYIYIYIYIRKITIESRNSGQNLYYILPVGCVESIELGNYYSVIDVQYMKIKSKYTFFGRLVWSNCLQARLADYY